MSWTIGVDVGGTFTDFYAANNEEDIFHVSKTPSTPENPAEAILTGLVTLCEQFNIPLNKIERLSHGTTVGTNALIQRTGSRVALITTHGFRDLLEIGRQTRPHMYDLFKDYPSPLVDRELRIELRERIDADGKVVLVPKRDEISTAIEKVIAADVSACAIGFLFAFRNPIHERQVRKALRKRSPDMAISLSSEVQPEFREYERTSTTVLNAYVSPPMSKYLSKLSNLLSNDMRIMSSSGGALDFDTTSALPVNTLLSGPAGGVVGAFSIA